MGDLQKQIDEAAAQLEHLELGVVKGHQLRAALKWELEGDRPSAFFFQKVQEQRAKKAIEEMLDHDGGG